VPEANVDNGVREAEVPNVLVDDFFLLRG
jgi:hypothetical protein